MNEKQAVVADDDAESRSATATMIRAEGYAVHTLQTGREVLEHLAQESADLVFLDATFPDMTGLEVLEQLRASRPAVPVIMMSAQGYVDSVVQALRLGAIDFLQKPLEREGVLRALALAASSAGDRRSETAPVDYGSRLVAARGALRAGLLTEARALLHRAIGLDPGRPEAFNLLGVAVARGGDPYRAQDFFRAALSVDPTYRPSQANLQRDAAGDPARLLLGEDDAPERGERR